MQTAEQDAITLSVNGATKRVVAGTLADVLHQLEYGDAKCATAVNGDFVAATARDTVHLKNGDKLEIVTARQGG